MKKNSIIISLLLIFVANIFTAKATLPVPLNYQNDDTIKNKKRGEPIADFDILPGKNVCVGDTISFINKSQNHIFSYWDFGDGTTTYLSNPVHTYFVPQLYRVRLLVKSDDNDSMFLDDYLLVNAIPSVRIEPSGTVTIKQGMELSVKVTDAFEEYFWIDEFGDTISTAPVLMLDNAYTKSKEGAIDIDVWVTDPIGCKNFTTLTVNIEKTVIEPENPDEVIIANNIITPNNDGYNDYLYVKELEAYLYPVVIRIYNVWGDLVYESDQYDNQWNGTESKVLDAGTYYYVAESKDRKGTVGFVDIIR